MLPVGDEPLVKNAVRDGADLVIFSGDKLLGGPQAGILVGSARWVSRMRRHPLARAMRADKLCLAALEATLTAYLEGKAPEEIPTVKMIQVPAADVKERAKKLAFGLRRAAPGLDVDVSPSVARQRRRHAAGLRDTVLRRSDIRGRCQPSGRKAARDDYSSCGPGLRKQALARRQDSFAGG